MTQDVEERRVAESCAGRRMGQGSGEGPAESPEDHLAPRPRLRMALQRGQRGDP